MLTRSRHQPNNFFGAVALVVGTAVGAGIFGLPYVFSQAGFGVGVLYLLGLGLMLLLVNLAYGEVVLSTIGTHQFPKYVEKYLGSRWKIVAIISTFIGLYGALTAYVIEVGHLLTTILQPVLGGDQLWYTLIYFAVVAAALLIGLRAVTNAEKIMMVAMLALIVGLVLFGWFALEPKNFTTVEPTGIFLPYGVILFALAAASAIPDMKNVLKRQEHKLKPAIIVGSIVPIIVYLVFTFMVVGISGPDTTPSAILGLGKVLGQPALLFGSIFGSLTMTTSFLLLGLVLKEVYQYDLGQRPLLAWLAVILPPLVIVLSNWLSFIEILGISGALIGGLDGIMIMKMHRHLLQHQDRTSEFTVTQSRIVHWLAYVIFMFGIAYEAYIVAGKFNLW